MGAAVPGQLSYAAGTPEMLLWCQSVNKVLAEKADLAGGSVGAQQFGGPQVFTGNSNSFTGGGPELSILGFGMPNVKISRVVPQSNKGINSALLIIDNVPQSAGGFEWAQLIQLNNAANAGEHVGLYSQVTKTGLAETWGITIEAGDSSANTGSAIVGMEVGIFFNGVDPGVGPTLDGVKQGITIVYGDHTQNGAGPVTSVGDLINCSPSNNIARFRALTLIKAHGCFSRAVFDVTNVHDTPISLAMGGGSALFFSSGTLAGPTATWFPGAYVPTIVGAIRIQIDGTDRWIAVSSNHP